MRHILDLIDCPFDGWRRVYKKGVQAIVAKSPYLKVETHKFEPQGVTGYALLEDSHISIND